MFKAISAIVLILSLMSCSALKPSLTANDILPRKGYVFIKKTVNLKKCEEDKCQTGRVSSVGSGFVVKITHKGAFIATAAHVCVTDKEDLLPGVTAVDTLKVETLDGRWYDTTMLEYDRELDACLMFAENLTDGIQEVPFSEEAPKEGDKVYNIASPYGIHYTDVVPIFEGRYFGEIRFKGFYSFNAAPGSSGSMILNEKGELIGLLHSVYSRMYTVVVSVRYSNLIQFLKHGIVKHAASHLKEAREYEKHAKILDRIKL